MTSSVLFADPTDTGASAAFTSKDPVVVQAMKMLDAGNYSRAEKLLATTQPSSDPSVIRAREEVIDLIARMRREYNLDEPGLLAKLKRRIPDATERDITHWREAGELQYRIIDDKLLYFGREPSNLFIFSADAKKRLPEKKDAAGWKLVDHLASIVKEAEATGNTEVCPVQHRVEYTITVPPSSLKPGATVRIWLPYPQEYRQQKDVKLISSTPSNPQIAPPAIDGNPVQHAQRTAYFEQRVDDPTKPITASITF
jgi:hypothetical protein